MGADIIEGEALEVLPERAIVVAQPGQAIVASDTATGPLEMLERAGVIATALTKMVEAQNLYTLIQGKKYPQVEAWMTIGRMDNVVAREAGNPERHEDGSYEAVVELIRLSDGMVIGRGSALCGTRGDRPWDSRPEPARRSMAVTRATSRAFRQQYSWIMALAGYEATPADEMPPAREDARQQWEGAHDEQRRPLVRETGVDGLIGKLVTSGTQDMNLRETPDGFILPFRLKDAPNRAGQIVIAHDTIAEALSAIKETVIGQTVSVWGRYEDVENPKPDGTVIVFKVLHLARIKTPDVIIPPDDGVVPGQVEAFDA